MLAPLSKEINIKTVELCRVVFPESVRRAVVPIILKTTQRLIELVNFYNGFFHH